MKYDVTIGIPVYRSGDYIRQALESALTQSYPSIEFLIVDDAGNDGSMDVVREFQSTHHRGKDIHIISHQENQGVSKSRNEIIDNAQGDYLYFLDSDDIIAEETIVLMMQNMLRYEAEMVLGSYEKIETSGEKVVYKYPSLHLLEKDAIARFAYRKYAGIQASACNYLVKTALLRENHLQFIDTDYWEDLVFTFDLVTYISRAVLLPDVTYTYICREGSLSHYQQRDVIPKEEIMKNVAAIDHLKSTSSLYIHKVYYPERCLNIVMTDFYMACHVLKRRHDIVPPITNREIKVLLRHPANIKQICTFRHSRIKNFMLFIIGKLPSSLCVAIIWSLGKIKKVI